MSDTQPTINDAAETKIVGRPENETKSSGKGKPAAGSEQT